MCLRNAQVVRQHGQYVEEIIHERLAARAAVGGCQLHPHQQLGDRDRSDCDVVVIADAVLEVGDVALGVDEDGGVEQEEAQRRSSTDSSARVSCRSSPQVGSGSWRASMALT